MLFMEKCLSGNIVLQNHLGAGVPEEAVVCWVLLGTQQEPGAGEAACAARAGC